jgi:hypothetical protein
MTGIPRRIQELQIQHFYKADRAYGTGVSKGLGLHIQDIVAGTTKVHAADENLICGATGAIERRGFRGLKPFSS